MPHLDDGQLHMVLDGSLDMLGEDRARVLRAHLRTCPDCRSRLEVEASIRDRADALLDVELPDRMELPSLADLQGEADRRTRRSRDGSLPRSLALAWAASLVLALGIGLYGPRLLERVEPAATPLRRVEPAAAPEGVGTPVDDEVAAAPGAVSKAEEEPPAPAERRAPRTGEGAPAPAAGPPAPSGSGRAVPGLPVLGREPLADGVTRTFQSLPGNDTLVVIHVPLGPGTLSSLSVEGVRTSPEEDREPAAGAPTDPTFGSMLSPRPLGWSEVVVTVEEGRALVFLRAPRSRSFLRELAERIR